MPPYTPVPYTSVPFVPDGRLGVLLRMSGEHQADAITRSGDLAAQLWSNLGNQISGTLNNYVKERQEAPIRAAQATELQQRNQLQGLQIAGAQRQAQDTATLDQAGTTAGADRASFLAQVPGHLRPDIEKKFADADKLAADAREAKQKADAADADYFGGLAASIKPYLTGPDGGMSAAQLALQHVIDNGNDDAKKHASAVQQQLQQSGPLALPTLIDSLIQASPTQRKLIAEEQDRALKQATEQRMAAQADASMRDKTADNARADQQLQETMRHNKATEAHQATTDAATPTLTPQGLDQAARRYLQDGSLPPMGMGQAGAVVRSKIVNRAAELDPNANIAANKAGLKADTDSLVQLTKQREAVGAFENTAKKNIDIFLGAAKKVVDSGSPLLNAPLRAISGRVLGAPDQAAFDAARQVAINEIAKITSNPNLSGTLSDSARHEVEAFNPGTATLKQTIAVMNVLKRDMDNRASSLDEQIGGIKKRIGGGNQSPASSGGTFSVTAPNGKTYTFKSQADLDAFKQKAGL